MTDPNALSIPSHADRSQAVGLRAGPWQDGPFRKHREVVATIEGNIRHTGESLGVDLVRYSKRSLSRALPDAIFVRVQLALDGHSEVGVCQFVSNGVDDEFRHDHHPPNTPRLMFYANIFSECMWILLMVPGLALGQSPRSGRFFDERPQTLELSSTPSARHFCGPSSK